MIHGKGDVLEIPYKTFGEILEELDSEQFVRCSRYAIINKRYIENIDYTNRFIKLKYVEEPIEIGIIMKNRFKEEVQ